MGKAARIKQDRKEKAEAEKQNLIDRLTEVINDDNASIEDKAKARSLKYQLLH